MIPSLLITIREVIEASLIVATIIGILTKLNQPQLLKTVWLGTISASLLSLFLVGIGSFFGLKVQELYDSNEQVIEGVLMIISAVFITWAVFFLHNYFAGYKTKLLHTVKETIDTKSNRGIFILVFTAVLREGIEIALFLSTIYLSDNPQSIFLGFSLGTVLGIGICFLFIKSILKLPVFYVFKSTSILLILFAAGLVGRAVHEFSEINILPNLGEITFSLLPNSSTFLGGIIKSVFGISNQMHLLQIAGYVIYILCMYQLILKERKVSEKV